NRAHPHHSGTLQWDICIYRTARAQSYAIGHQVATSRQGAYQAFCCHYEPYSWMLLQMRSWTATCYQMGHTYASMILSAGENPAWIARRMGHADWGMLRRIYARRITGV